MKTINSDIVNIKSGINVLIYKPVNIYDCILGDNVFIGPFVEIQRGTKIGNNTRIQSHTFICEDVVIGDNCFIGHNVTFANDLFKNGSPCGDKSTWLRIEIGNNVSIGSGAVVLTEKICSGVVIGAGSVVTKPILTAGVYAGNPARLIRKI